MAKKPQAHADRAHAKLSPSGAYRWFACRGAPTMEAPFPSKSSVFADEGTAAHELSQHCLDTGFDASRFVGMWVDLTGEKPSEKFIAVERGKRCFEVTDEMVDAVQIYIDDCRQYMAEPEAECEIEARLDLRHIPGLEFGTGDFTAYLPQKKMLVIRDLKYGKGVPVEVEGNLQGLTYTEGLIKRYDNRGIATIDIGIVQPRCPHKDGPVRTWVIDALDMVDFRHAIVDAAAATLEAEKQWGAFHEHDDRSDWIKENLVPGDHCKFCKAAPTCPALTKFALETAEMEFADEPPSVTDMEPAQIAEVMAKADVIEGWVKRVKQRGHDLALEGKNPPGWKLVHSTSHRKFKDEVSAGFLEDMLGIDLEELQTEPKLRSPAQVEKLLGAKRKKEIADLVFKPKGKVILAPESDPRDPVKPDAEDEFA